MKTASQVFAAKSFGTDTARVARILSHAPTALVCDSFVSPEVAQSMTNQKAQMRLLLACEFIATGDLASMSKSKVHAVCIAVLMLSTQARVDFGSLHSIVGSTRSEGTLINGVSKAKLNRYVARVTCWGTVTSQVSNLFGINGWAHALGLVVRANKSQIDFAPDAKSNPLMLAYAARLQGISDRDLDLIYSPDKQ